MLRVCKRSRKVVLVPELLPTSAVAERVELTEVVRCDVCGVRFQLTARNVREWRRHGRQPRCLHCRWPHKAMTDAERMKDRTWWIAQSGLSASELYGIAVGLG